MQASIDLYGSSKSRISGFIDIRHMKMVTLSAPHTNRIYSQEIPLEIVVRC
jgi:hypothetical protein